MIDEAIAQLTSEKERYEFMAKEHAGCHCCPNPERDRYEYIAEGFSEALEILERIKDEFE